MLESSHYLNRTKNILQDDDDTFREACLKDWQFDSIEPGHEWIIQDEQGNDISNRKLLEYHGIAKIISVAPMESRTTYEEGRTKDGTNVHSDIDQGVEFYN